MAIPNFEVAGAKSGHQRWGLSSWRWKAGFPSQVVILTPLIADSLAQLPKPLLDVVAKLFIAAILFFTNSVFHTALLTKVPKWNYIRPRVENSFKQYPAITVTPPATY